MFRFECPEHLYALLLIPLLGLGYALFLRARNQRLARLGDPATLARLMPGVSMNRSHWKWAIYSLALALIVIGWANPQWGSRLRKVNQQSADIFIAFDISQSMMAEDLAPNRLERAKRFGQKLVEGLRGQRIGLIVFAGGAYLQSPLTTDYGAADLFIRSIHPRLAPYQGTSVASAIDLAERIFPPEAAGRKAMIILSDGESHDEDALARAQQAADNGLLFFTIAAGSESGAPIPVELPDGTRTYKLDQSGQQVVSRVNTQILQDIAATGQGEFFVLGANEEAMLQRIRESVEKLEKQETEQRVFEEYASYFQYFIGAGLLLLLIESLIAMRKNTALLLALFLLPLSGVQAQKGHSQLRQGDQAYRSGDFAEAETHYRKAREKSAGSQAGYNLGNALYQLGRFDEAAKYYEMATQQAETPGNRADAWFNLGNAHFEAQKFQEAIDAYKNALKNNPADADAQYNLSQALRQLKAQQQQKQEQQKKEQEQQQQQEQEQQQQQNQDQASNQQPQDGQAGDQEQESDARSSSQPRDLTREEAQKLLEIMDREEQRTQEKLRRQGGQPPRPVKDW